MDTIKRVQDLDFKINAEDQREVKDRFTNDYNIKVAVKDGIKITEHLEEDHYCIENSEIFDMLSVLTKAIKVLSLSVDCDDSPIERVHYIISKDFKQVLVYIELKTDEISQIIIPRFLGNKFSNIEALRRISTNLSGQYGVKTRFYI